MTWRESVARSRLTDGSEWLWVAVADWRTAHMGLQSEGLTRLEHLTAYDSDGRYLVSSVSDQGMTCWAHVVAGPTDVIDSLHDLYATAMWHQREAAQMLGISFAGMPGCSPAFDAGFEGHPLRADYALEPRVTQVWPGAVEPGETARRRPVPSPGVKREWLP